MQQIEWDQKFERAFIERKSIHMLENELIYFCLTSLIVLIDIMQSNDNFFIDRFCAFLMFNALIEIFWKTTNMNFVKNRWTWTMWKFIFDLIIIFVCVILKFVIRKYRTDMHVTNKFKNNIVNDKLTWFHDKIKNDLSTFRTETEIRIKKIWNRQCQNKRTILKIILMRCVKHHVNTTELKNEWNVKKIKNATKNTLNDFFVNELKHENSA